MSAIEATHAVGAFNGRFRLDVAAGGFFSYGRTAVPLRDGPESIVSYADGSSDIGVWGREVPAPGRRVVSVRRNLTPLIDRGAAAPTASCLPCWGATLGGVTGPARSGIGVTASGELPWPGGEHLTVAKLASALRSAGVARAIELDINPEWVAAYLYGRRGGREPLAPIPMVPGQPGVPGQFLAPYSRDFFTVVAISR